MQGIALAIVSVLFVVGALAVTFSGIWWLPPLASNWGSLDTMLVITLIVTGVAFVGVNVALAYFVFRYRHREGSQAVFQPEHHKLERTLIILTTIGIVVLLAPGLFVYSEFIHAPSDAMVVDVVGQQWTWGYRYAGSDGVLGRTDPRRIGPQNLFGIDPEDPAGQDDVLVYPGGALHLPLGRPILLELRAKDVLHSFYVPQFRIKMDTVPGLVTHLWFIPTKTGTFEVLCAELCGIGHFNMKSAVVVESEQEFENWLQQQPTVTQTLSTAK
jgi:cytochrome c oxidase subunit 2